MKLKSMNPLATIVSIPAKVLNLSKEILFLSKFIVILSLYSIHAVMSMITCHRWIKPVFKPICRPMTGLLFRTIAIIDRPSPQQIAALDLVILAYDELKVKKVRSIITIGGMSLGFGLIVFLLSIGYGLERLVVSRVANLNELRQADLLVNQASSLYIDNSLILNLQQRAELDAVLPQVSLVAKINYNNSVADAVVYGVTTRYLQESAVQPVEGTIFSNEEFRAFTLPDDTSTEATDSGEVAGTTIELLSAIAMGREVNKIRYSIYPLTWVAVHEGPSQRSPIIGYTNRQPGPQEALEVWGAPYSFTPNAMQGLDPNEQRYSTWVQDTFPIWAEQPCAEAEIDCHGGTHVVNKEQGSQQLRRGYIMENQVSLERYSIITDPTAKPGFGARIQTVTFRLPRSPVPVFALPSLEAALEQESTQIDSNNVNPVTGTLVYGLNYYDQSGYGSVAKETTGRSLGYWIEATLPLWYTVGCVEDCDLVYLPKLDSSLEHISSTVYIRASDVLSISPPPPNDQTFRTSGQVLGRTTISDELLEKVLGEMTESTESSQFNYSQTIEEDDVNSVSVDLEDLDFDTEWASIASIAGIIKPREVETLLAGEALKKTAIVNVSFLTMLGIPLGEAVGTTFDSTLVFDGRLFGDDNYRAESTPIDYTIIGVLPDNKTPAIHVPLSDIQSFGLSRYSQLKIMVNNQNQLASVRSDVETLGFKTNSVVDTVEQINALFRSLRLALSVVGLVALGVATLGMFNTLTVSLLEKTRQVGLMKAMGMKSHEVKRLFLAESLIMGVAGGLLGLGLAFLGGKFVSGILSSMAITQGAGVIDVAHIPFALSVFVLSCSFVMGIVTGWYPSRRATKISALNALRYE